MSLQARCGQEVPLWAPSLASKGVLTLSSFPPAHGQLLPSSCCPVAGSFEQSATTPITQINVVRT